MTKVGERLSVFAFATFVVLAIVVVSFAAGQTSAAIRLGYRLAIALSKRI